MQHEWLPKPGLALLMGVGLALVAVIVLLDYLTGYEISFGLFYVVPVAIVAWLAPRRTPGVAIAMAGAVGWYVADVSSGRHFSLPVIPYWNAGTRLGFFLIVALLLAALRRALEREHSLARTDFMSGALNSRAFTERAEQEIARAARHGHPLTVAYLDIDDFKRINDHYGHRAGDQVIAFVVGVIREELRGSDILARLGGDEFALMLPETGPEGARAALPKLLDALAARTRREGWPVSFSAGVLSFVEPPGSVDEMIGMTDRLMYAAKRGGKNRAEFGTHPLSGSHPGEAVSRSLLAS